MILPVWITLILSFLYGRNCQPTAGKELESQVQPLQVVSRPIVAPSTTGSIPEAEMQSLRDLYYAMQGYGWTWKIPYSTFGFPWNVTDDDENPCTRPWQGITCIQYLQPDSLYAISDVALVEYNLRGTLPESLSQLTQLNTLEITNNPYLVGTLPNSLGNLSQLQVLDFTYNALTGTIPNSFGNLSQLVTINFYTNHLHGTIPNSLSKLHNLQYMGLAINSFTGTISDSFGNLSQLQYMYLSFNQLSGTVPYSLGRLSKLKLLDLQVNRITGSIPNSLGNLSQLSTLNLYTMDLTGSIPSSLGNLSYLYFFDLENNKLTGTIPYTLGNLTILNYLNFENNLLTGTLPLLLSNLFQLAYLELDENLFTGTIPTALGQLTQLRYLYLDNNNLVGTIPDSLGGLPQLEILHLHANMLTGYVPRTFAQLNVLLEMFLKDNRLTGTLENVINATTQLGLNTIQVENNQLTGTLPSNLFHLPKLTTLVADNNCFHGTLPLSVCDARNVHSILLNGLSSASSCQHRILSSGTKSYVITHSVHGQLPACVLALPKLISLQLSGNGFTGPLPENITISTTVLDLALSHNILTGSIPRSVQEKQWYNLDLSFNRFSGSLLSSFASKTFGSNASISLENNRISGNIPSAVKQLPEISILGSNMFTCRTDRSELPRHDEGRHNYQCGSNDFDAPYYVWFGLVALCVVVIATMTREKKSNWNEKARLGAFGQRLNSLCKVAQLSSAYIVVVLLPVFCICKVYYGTFLHTYAWSVSAAFVSGTVPFSLEFVLFIGLLILVIYVVTRLQSVEDSHVAAATPVNDATIVAGSNFRSVCFIYGIYILLNTIVVVGVNAIYVYVAVYQSNDLQLLAQVLLSFFKIAWNSVCAPRMLQYIATNISNAPYSELQYSALLIFVVLGNNIVIPCIVEASISPSCFYNVFINAPQVKSHYDYQTCISVSVNTGECLKYEIETSTTSYSPPFTYSYQCSASLITHYAPAFVIMCIVNTFAVPAVQLLLQYFYQRADSHYNSLYFRCLESLVPLLLKPTTQLNDDNNNMLNLNRVVVSLVSYVGLILTFGAVFPPLAVAFLVSILAIVYFTQYKVCYFVENATEHMHTQNVGIVERECDDVGKLPIWQYSMWMLVSVSACFYTWFLFEILGDAVGLKGSYWVLITVPLLPLCLYILCSVYIRLGAEVVRNKTVTSTAQEGEIEIEVIDRAETATYNVMIAPSPV